MSRSLVTAFASGLLFGAGLVVSDMVNPARVLAFLDVGGAWDPTLGFVMAGALFPMSLAWMLVRRRGRRTLGGETVVIPKGTPVDGRLVGGAALFGIGWGLVGLCPGPALAALALGGAEVWIFAAAMIGGVAAAGVLGRRA
jgi:uncharacterized membrane protein YedE/YeeE